MSLPLAIYLALGLVAFVWLLVGMTWNTTGGRLNGPWSDEGRVFSLPFVCWLGGGVLGFLAWRLTS